MSSGELLAALQLRLEKQRMEIEECERIRNEELAEAARNDPMQPARVKQSKQQSPQLASWDAIDKAARTGRAERELQRKLNERMEMRQEIEAERIMNANKDIIAKLGELGTQEALLRVDALNGVNDQVVVMIEEMRKDMEDAQARVQQKETLKPEFENNENSYEQTFRAQRIEPDMNDYEKLLRIQSEQKLGMQLQMKWQLENERRLAFQHAYGYLPQQYLNTPQFQEQTQSPQSSNASGFDAEIERLRAQADFASLPEWKAANTQF